LLEGAPKEPESTSAGVGGADLRYSRNEWAEELASIAKRRNLLESDLRSFVRNVLKLRQSMPWTDAVRAGLSEKRRQALAGISGTGFMEQLYWLELRDVILKYWTHFESVLGDRDKLNESMTLVNERPDAHAKEVDVADVALHRRALEWLEGRVR
jgi:hypothetical protein